MIDLCVILVSFKVYSHLQLTNLAMVVLPLIRYLIIGTFMILGSDCIAQDHCWIKYRYDGAGNRIQRYWWCGDPTEVDEEPNDDTKMIKAKDFGLRLFPNPANDLIQLRSKRY